MIRVSVARFSTKKELPALKYFINKSVVLAQYREALKLSQEFEDLDTRE
jgi:hypothetical protein